MRLAYSLLVLATLAAIMQLGSPSAAIQPGTPEPAKKTTAAVWSADGSESNEAAPAATPDPPARPGKTPDDAPAAARSTSAPQPSEPPVFYRPSPAVPGLVPGGVTGGAWEPGGRPVCGDLARFPSSSEVLFPLSRAHFGSYDDTWGAPRPQGGHEGTDLMVPAGTPEYAITAGTVVPVAGSNENGWNSLGGYAVMLEAAYSVGPIRKGDLFYYAHLQRPSDLEIGATVQAGQVLGYAGDTGQGPEVTSGLFPPHLHFGWYDTSGARSALDSGAMNPFPLLGWIESNGGALRGGSDARYCEAPQTGVPKPSGGQDRWPAPKNPGARPDLHAASPKPSPVSAKHGSRKPAPDRATESTPGKPGARSPEEQGDRPAAERQEPPAKPPPPAPRTEKVPPPGHPEPHPGGTTGKENEPQPPPARDDIGGAGDPAPPDEKGETSGGGGDPQGDQPGEERPGQDGDGEKGREEEPHPPPDPPGEHQDKDEKGKDEKPHPEDEEQQPDGDVETTTPEGVGEETVPEATTEPGE